MTLSTAYRLLLEIVSCSPSTFITTPLLLRYLILRVPTIMWTNVLARHTRLSSLTVARHQVRLHLRGTHVWVMQFFSLMCVTVATLTLCTRMSYFVSSMQFVSQSPLVRFQSSSTSHSGSGGGISGLVSRITSFFVGAGLMAFATQIYLYQELRDGNHQLLTQHAQLEQRMAKLEQAMSKKK